MGDSFCNCPPRYRSVCVHASAGSMPPPTGPISEGAAPCGPCQLLGPLGPCVKCAALEAARQAGFAEGRRQGLEEALCTHDQYGKDGECRCVRCMRIRGLMSESDRRFTADAQLAAYRSALEVTPKNLLLVGDAIDGASLQPQDCEIQAEIRASLTAAATRVLQAIAKAAVTR